MGEAANVYAGQLSSLAYGHPLWFPDPDPRDGEIHIGDVGFLDDGRFCRILNIFKDKHHEWNARGVPQDHIPLKLSGNLFTERRNYLNPGFYASHSVKTFQVQPELSASALGAPAQAEISYKFECSEERGAFLVLKHSASMKKIYHSQELDEYISRNHESWHTFITQRLGIKCRLEDTVCIFGCVKTSEWTVSAILRSEKSHGGSIKGQCTAVAGGGFKFQITETSEMKHISRTGPARLFGPNGSHKGHDVLRNDQCIFVSFYKVKYRPLLAPKVIQAGAEEPRQDHPGSPDDPRSNDCVDYEELKSENNMLSLQIITPLSEVPRPLSHVDSPLNLSKAQQACFLDLLRHCKRLCATCSAPFTYPGLIQAIPTFL